MILAINTAQAQHELALIEGGKLLTQRIWTDDRNDLEKLIPTLQEMLDEIGMQKVDITEIVVCVGPGHYTAVRTGVSFANALAQALGARLYEINTFQLLNWKIASTEPTITLTNAGGLDVGMSFDGEIKVGEISDLLAPISHGKVKVAAELNETLSDELRSICAEKGWEIVTGEKLQTMGEALLTFDLKNLKATDNAEVFYLKDPKITKSSDPWKKP